MKTGGRRKSGFPAGLGPHWYDQIQQAYSGRRAVTHIIGLLHNYPLLSQSLLQLGMKQSLIEPVQGGTFGYLHPRVNGNVFETEEGDALRIILGAYFAGKRQRYADSIHERARSHSDSVDYVTQSDFSLCSK